jgi:hydrogenase-4 component E
MHLTSFEMLEVSAAIVAIMMLGTTNVRSNFVLFSLQTILLCALTAWIGELRSDETLTYVALMVVAVKAVFTPAFLAWIMHRLNIHAESSTFIPAPIAMHLGIVVLGISYLLAQRLPNLANESDATMGATGAFSLLLMGMLLMVTRKLAVNQVLGFLVIENGIFMFSLTQTRDMPLIVEMGILLDVLVGVMIAGLLLFRIKKSFEHIDVTQLTHLKD